ncbi:MAG: 4-hydroxythreonine-4-phosphate dehydrogenase PdxA [Geobacter sp.]|nr:MAG: 4-hydroxythreonine-4-phosphate dehydrogenase PdxA [Geobacter sp.]
MSKPVIAITMGDPCGIGPEIITMALANPEIESLCRPLVLGDQAAMERALAVTQLPLRLELLTKGLPPKSTKGVIYLRPLSRLAATDMEYGGPSSDAGDAMYRYIKEAVQLCQSGEAAAMANAPISKEAMNRAGHYYPGHTELVAELTGCTDYVMMLAGDRLRVTLVTIHEAISNVPRLITFDKVLSTIRTTHRSLHTYFRKNPRLAVLALNPHCGEKGLFGDEERRFIAPAIEAARAEGIDAHGPLSADMLFYFATQGEYDGVVCMYHDQGLIPLKLIHFHDGVNVTLGLPIIRTSVDHGTAYDLAGTGRASALSIAAAIRMAVGMAKTASENSPPKTKNTRSKGIKIQQ